MGYSCKVLSTDGAEAEKHYSAGRVFTCSHIFTSKTPECFASAEMSPYKCFSPALVKVNEKQNAGVPSSVLVQMRPHILPDARLLSLTTQVLS